jgi:replicative DNA helicase
MGGVRVKDQNDRLLDGTLPANPGDGATPIPLNSSARKNAEQQSRGRTDPCDVPAETALLSALIWCGTYPVGTATYNVEAVADLIDGDDAFIVDAHRFIWAAMLELHKRGVPCDATATHSELVRQKKERIATIEYLEELLAGAAPVTTLKLREYAASIRETWLRRKIIQTARNMIEEARDPQRKAAEVANEFAGNLREQASMGGRDATFVHISVPLDNMAERAGTPPVERALTTGLPKVDELLQGGLRRKQVTVLAARTSVGKSALALEIALAAYAADPTAGIVYITMEMSEAEFSERLVSSRTGVEAIKIATGTATPDECRKIRTMANILRATDIYFNVKQNLTLGEIRNIIHKVSLELVPKGKRVGLVVVDHIGLVKSAKTKSSREQEVAETSRGLRDLASEFDCHVLALAQISREAEKQTGKSVMPKLHHLRESGSIEQDTNNVLILHRERDENGVFKDKEPAKLAVAKARNGRLGIVWVAVEPTFVRFMPWEGSKQEREYSLSRYPR